MIEFSPILEAMKEFKIPLTRDNYLKLDRMGTNKKVDAEGEAQLPSRFAYPVVEPTELPEPKSILDSGKKKGKKTGAPVNFPGPVFPNPKGIKPMLDTERPEVKPNPYVKRLPMPITPQKRITPTPSGDFVKPIPPAPLEPGIEPNPLIPREQ